MDVRRIAAVTAGLAVAGALVGAVVGVAVSVARAWMGGYGVSADDFLFGGLFGGVAGVVLGPAAAWLLMRHVPLGLAVGGTALGTLAGAVAGLRLDPHGPLLSALICGLGGFILSAIVLWIFTPRRAAVPRGPSA